MTDTIERELAEGPLACDGFHRIGGANCEKCILRPSVAAWAREREHENLLALSDAAKLAHKLRTERDALRAEVEKLTEENELIRVDRDAWRSIVGRGSDGALRAEVETLRAVERAAREFLSLPTAGDPVFLKRREAMRAALDAAKPKGDE